MSVPIRPGDDGKAKDLPSLEQQQSGSSSFRPHSVLVHHHNNKNNKLDVWSLDDDDDVDDVDDDDVNPEEISDEDDDMFTVPDVEALPPPPPKSSNNITSTLITNATSANNNNNPEAQSGFPGKRRRGRNPVDKEYRRLKRLLRNRVSAQQARERKKVYVNDLESRAKDLEDSNSKLEEKISTLINENAMLRKVLMNTRPKVDESIEQKQDQFSKSRQA